MITPQQIMLLGANLAKLGTRRLALLAIVGLGVMATVGLAAHYLSRPSMQAIYTGLTSQDVSRMTAALAEVGLPFDVNEQRNAILVPFGQAARARMLLAQKGLPSSSRAGYELFDQMGSMGLTSFMQEVTRVRALEGEISRTIQALDGVSAARVHLVLPESSSFRRERRDPSASVLLRLDGRWNTSASEVVRHIVAAAVPGLKAEQISVASSDGRLLVSGGDETRMGSFKLAEMERSMGAELEQRASRTLTSALGAGNFQISVTASLDVDRQQINETLIDPKSRVERSMRVVKQSGSTEDSGGRAAVGAEANVPREENSQPDADRRRQRDDRREELVNYEFNSKTVQTVREGHRVKSIAIAVVVNRPQLAAQLGGKTDPAAVEAKLAELKRLVTAATGAKPDDHVEISAADFSSADSLAAAPSPGVTDYLMMNLGTIINATAMLGIVLIVVMLGLRPLLSAFNRQNESDAAAKPLEGPNAPAVANQAAAQQMEALEFQNAAIAQNSGQARLPRAEPGREAVIRERLDALVAANDVKVAKVLKGWMAEASET